MINKLIAGTLPYMPPKLIWIFSKRYIAGSTVDDAIQASLKLNDQGMRVTLDILGEFIHTLEEAEKNRNEYIDLIERVEKENITGSYSVKPTMFGLLIDEEACYEHFRAIVGKATEHGNFIRIDMEDASCTDKTIRLFRRLKEEFPKNVGLVVQAYLHRTYQDIQDLLDIHSEEFPMNYRLCKGIYVESADIAFKDKDEINANYLKDLELMMQKGIMVGIATHDKFLLDGALALVEKYQVPKDKYEFQMLYGVTPDLARGIVDGGHPIRIYVPYGEKWFGYSTRRLKENPKMASHIIKAIFVHK